MLISTSDGGLHLKVVSLIFSALVQPAETILVGEVTQI